MPNTNCPTLKDFILADDCSENFGGMGTTVYVFKRKDLAKSALALVSGKEATYQFSTNPIVAGGRLWKFECKRESQQAKGESQGPRKGFIISVTFVIDAVNEKTAGIAKALNNGDLGFVILDNDSSTAQLLFHESRRCEIDSGGLTTDTGAAASDDRQMSVTVTLGPVSYPNYFLQASSTETSLKDELDGMMKEVTATTGS